MIGQLLFDYILNKHFILQLLATLTVYSAINLVIYYGKRQKRYQLLKSYGIPGPEPRLFDGSFYEYQSNPASCEVDLKFLKTYGKTYGFYIGDETNIVTTDLEKLRKIFMENSKSFTERAVPFIDTPLSYGVLYARHDRWKLFRKLMSPFFNSRTVRGGSSTLFIEESIAHMIKYIEEKFGETQTEVSVDIHDLMKACALHMISSMAINLPDVQVRENEDHVNSLDAFLIGADKGAVVLATKLPFLQHFFAFLAANFEHGKTLALIRRGIDYNMKNSKTDQDQKLIHLLVKLYQEGRIDRSEVIGNCESILFAGYDTTSTTLAYVFWVLGKHPDIQEKLRKDLIAHGTDSEYLEQVLNETMRMYPTVFSFTSRLATETVIIDEELTVPEGCRVIYNHWLIFRNPDIWPNPDKFDPERFREGTNHHPCAFAPFGMGERKCLGYQLAKLEMKMITCDILLRYRVNLKSPQDLELVSYATVLSKPKEKVVVGLERL